MRAARSGASNKSAPNSSTSAAFLFPKWSMMWPHLNGYCARIRITDEGFAGLKVTVQLTKISKAERR